MEKVNCCVRRVGRGRADLWHPFWRNEGAGFDVCEAGLRQLLYQLYLHRQGDRLLLILQSIAGAYFDNLDEVVCGVMLVIVVRRWLGRCG